MLTQASPGSVSATSVLSRGLHIPRVAPSHAVLPCTQSAHHLAPSAAAPRALSFFGLHPRGLHASSAGYCSTQETLPAQHQQHQQQHEPPISSHASASLLASQMSQDPTAQQEQEQQQLQQDLDLQAELLGQGQQAISQEEQSEGEQVEEEEAEDIMDSEVSPEQQRLENGIRTAEFPVQLRVLLDGQIDLLDSR